MNFYWTVVTLRVWKESEFNQVLASNPQAIRGGEFPIAGIYTKKGYLTVILPNSKSILREAIEENWVLNKEESYSDSEFKYLHKQILNLYFADYRKKWSRALAKISVPKYVDPKDLTEQLALFSSPASPIVDILRAVKKNTYLLTQPTFITYKTLNEYNTKPIPKQRNSHLFHKSK
jgi:type VI secretion system protein ImpL